VDLGQRGAGPPRDDGIHDGGVDRRLPAAALGTRRQVARSGTGDPSEERVDADPELLGERAFEAAPTAFRRGAVLVVPVGDTEMKFDFQGVLKVTISDESGEVETIEELDSN
jgi:hypothetical protein